MNIQVLQYLVFRRGIIYEGNNDQLWALYPRPFISSVVDTEYVFREYLYDPLTRIRRGIFYKPSGDQGGHHWQASCISNGIYGPLIGINLNEFDDEGRYIINNAEDVLHKNIVKIGDNNNFTTWSIIDNEINIFGQNIFTLRNQSMLGVLPKLHTILLNEQGEILNEDVVKSIKVSLNNVINVYHRFQPVPMVDATRETTRIILAAWIGKNTNGYDLGNIIKKIPEKNKIIEKAATIINLSHPHTRSTEQEKQAEKGNIICKPIEEDAQTGIYLIGMILREIGWSDKP